MAEAQSEDQNFADAVSSHNEAAGDGAEVQPTEPQPEMPGSSTGDGEDRGKGLEKNLESQKMTKGSGGAKHVSSGESVKVTGRRRTLSSSASSSSQRMSREDLFTAEVDTTSLLASAVTSSMEISGPYDDSRARNRRLQSKLCCCGLCHCLTAKKCVIGSAVSALVLIILAVVMYGVAIPRFHYYIKQNAVLKEGQSPEWQKPTGTAFLTIYFFNVTNHDAFDQGLEPPVVEEKGPYVFRITMEKVNVTWNDNFTVTYEDNHVIEFVPSLSNGTVNDTIITSTELQSTNDKRRLKQETAGFRLDERVTGVLQAYTVSELFNLYRSRVFKLSDHASDVTDHASDVTDFLLTLHTQNEDNSTEILHIDTDNRTYGVMNVYTGENNFSRFNEFYSWDYNTILDVWTSDEARELSGTDGYLFNPFVEETSKLTIFDPELFRTFDLEFKERVTFKGAAVLRFIIPDSELSNGTGVDNRTRLANHPSRVASWERGGDDKERAKDFRDSVGGYGSEKRNKFRGYCTPTCIPAGVYNVSTCTGGAPFYISLPHFLGADQFYLNKIVGLSPDESKHRPYFDVHALTGHVLYQRRSHQLNALVTSHNAPEVYLPLYWSEPSMEASDTTLRKAKEFHLTNSALNTFLYCLLGAVGLAVFHLLTVGGCRMRLIFFNNYATIPDPPPNRPPCYCCCHCSPCYKEFTYCMFRICADD
ncbi:unnamed protein product [Lymnaea stagnalis]|uniref:Scavenger receptor class B member 1 n=1 Tax=Lymnaea stagnalis TaxID=6523 RepID=A0AAV2HKB7_LYMST